jgi:hypothetical protein
MMGTFGGFAFAGIPAFAGIGDQPYKNSQQKITSRSSPG